MKLTNLSTTPKIQYADHKATWQDLVGMLFLIAACWLVMGLTDGMDAATKDGKHAAPIKQQSSPFEASLARWPW